MITYSNQNIKLLTFLFLCFIAIDLHAQFHLKDGLNLNFNYHQGIIIPEFDLLTHIEEDNTQTFEVSLSKRTLGKNNGQHLYNYPEFGASFYYTSLGHHRVLGSIVGLDYFIKVNLAEKNKLSFYGQTGIGMNYLSKIQDPVDNPLNTSMGSHFGFHFNLRFGTTLFLSKKLAINLGPSFDHFSNANIKFPNRGINAVAFFGGMTYHFGEEIEKPEKGFIAYERKTNIEVITNFGFKHVTFPTDTYHGTPSLLIELNNNTLQFLRLGVGAEIVYDASVKPKLEFKGVTYKNIYSYQSGIYISQAFVYEKFNFVLQEGWHFLLAKELGRENLYNRVLFKYHFHPKFSTHISLTGHLQNLEYVGVGVGYKFVGQ